MKPVTANLAKIPDTPERLAKSSQLVRDLMVQNNALVAERNNLMLVLNANHKISKMDIIRDAGTSRTFFVGKPSPGDPDRDIKPNPGGLLSREPAVLEPIPGTTEELRARLRHVRDQINGVREVSQEARDIRNEAAEELLFHPTDPWPNHRICEVSGMESDRVAKLRTAALKRTSKAAKAGLGRPSRHLASV